MFNLFGGSSPSQEVSLQQAPSPLKERLLQVAEQYQGQLPPMVGVMLKGFLPNFTSVEDETILGFIQNTRRLLTYVETGELPPEDVSADAADQDG